jgi:hypothetical protein
MASEAHEEEALSGPSPPLPGIIQPGGSSEDGDAMEEGEAGEGSVSLSHPSHAFFQHLQNHGGKRSGHHGGFDTASTSLCLTVTRGTRRQSGRSSGRHETLAQMR